MHACGNDSEYDIQEREDAMRYSLKNKVKVKSAQSGKSTKARSRLKELFVPNERDVGKTRDHVSPANWHELGLAA
jgi:hypothetical protein